MGPDNFGQNLGISAVITKLMFVDLSHLFNRTCPGKYGYYPRVETATPLRVYTLRKRLFIGQQGSRIEISFMPIGVYFYILVNDMTWGKSIARFWYLIILTKISSLSMRHVRVPPLFYSSRHSNDNSAD